jgi:uncharacterized protein YbjT (DUF2867 family)
MRILVTGGTGTLGRAFVTAMRETTHGVRVASRKPRPADFPGGATVEWARMDFRSGSGIAEAVEGVEAVLHAATVAGFGSEAVDVEGTRRLASAARRAGVAHFVYPSIVGIDTVPLRYYRRKQRAETIVRESGVPWTILRATQFYELVDGLIGAAARVPFVVPLPTAFQGQPVAAQDVARRLQRVFENGPAGRAPDVCGPERTTLGALARDWLAVRRVQKRVVRVPLPGRVARAFRRGACTCEKPAPGAVRWRTWLEEQPP